MKRIQTTIKALLVSGLLFLYAINAGAQGIVSGTILDENSSPLPTANVLLMQPDDSSVVKGAVTDQSGVYELRNLPPGPYLLSVSMVGFRRYVSSVFELSQSSIEFDAISLELSVEQMGEVDVTARRPMFEQEIDRLVVNVQQSITASGSSVLEVLEKSPGIQVNRQSNAISMSGKTGVRVMINDKFVQLPIDAVVQMLDGMNAANIEQIELITTPPARYEAEGDAGIIHIKMKEFTEMGTTGTLGGNLGHNYAETVGGNFNISRRGKHLALFIDYSINYDRTQHFWDNNRFLMRDGFREEISSENNRHPSIVVQNARAGMEFNLNRKTTAGLLFTGYQRHWKTRDLSDNFNQFSPTSILHTEMSVRETNNWRNGLVNISLDHSFNNNRNLSFDADYLYFVNDNPSYYKNTIIEGDDSLLSRDNIDVTKKTPIHIRVVKLDYRENFSDTFTLETGIKGSLSDFTNEVNVLDLIKNDWVSNNTFTHNADLSEKTGAAYISGSWKPDESIQLNAGLRFEYTDRFLSTPDSPGLVDAQNGNLFPTFFFQKNLQDEKSIGFSYARRITRPTFNDLAPFVYFIDPNTFLSGNPDLNPAISDAFKLDYNLNQWLLSLQYSYTKDELAPFQPNIDQENNEQTLSTQNLSNFQSYVINTSFPIFFTSWWELRPNLSGRYQVFKTRHLNDNLTSNSYGFTANLINSIDLPREFSLEISGYYQSKSVWGIWQFKPMGSFNAGIQKRLADGQATLRLSADDIFRTNLWRSNTDVPGANMDSEFFYDFSSRNVKLTFTWNFGNSKMKSVNVSTGSEEEQGRVTN